MANSKADIIHLIKNMIPSSVFSVASVKAPTNTEFQNLIPILMWTIKKDIFVKNQIVLAGVSVSAIDHLKQNLNFLIKKFQLHKDLAGLFSLNSRCCLEYMPCN